MRKEGRKEGRKEEEREENKRSKTWPFQMYTLIVSVLIF